MTKIDALPADLAFVANGHEDGLTWIRFTDGERDFMVVYNVAEKTEIFFVID